MVSIIRKFNTNTGDIKTYKRGKAKKFHFWSRIKASMFGTESIKSNSPRNAFITSNKNIPRSIKRLSSP